MNHIEIDKLQRREDIETCARFMADSDPWKTLGINYQNALERLSDASREVYLARILNEPVGFIILLMEGAFTGYIQTVCVHPLWRGRSIGSRLIQFAEERIFRERPNVFMCVSSFNHEAQKLYERLGYERIGELKDYIVSGHSEILLRKTIAPLMEFKRK
jgi:ribosomal protein S18 acetylase RimI-like enzyme